MDIWGYSTSTSQAQTWQLFIIAVCASVQHSHGCFFFPPEKKWPECSLSLNLWPIWAAFEVFVSLQMPVTIWSSQTQQVQMSEPPNTNSLWQGQGLVQSLAPSPSWVPSEGPTVQSALMPQMSISCALPSRATVMFLLTATCEDHWKMAANAESSCPLI